VDYNRVALFVRVVKTGSFTAAAAQVGLPKSSVSRSVAHLEDDLGVRLLQRTTRKLALTDAGQAYYESVAGSVGAIDEAVAAARERGQAPRGVVRLTCPPDMGDLAGALAGFMRKQPGIRIELSITPRYVDLVAEGFDLAVRAGRMEDSSLVVRRIGASEMALFASPGYLRAHGRPKTPAELGAHDWVVYRASSGRTTIHLSSAEGEHALEVTPALMADDIAFCRAAVEAGAGIGLLPIHTVAASAHTGQLEQVLPAWTYGGASLFVVLPSARQLPARVALARDFLVEHLTQLLAETRERCDKVKKKA